MKMKRILSIFLAMMLMVSILSGCAPKEENVIDEGQAPVATPAEGETEDVDASDEEVELNSEAVILEKTIDYMNNIPANSNMIPAKDAMDVIENTPDAILLVDMRAKEDYDNGHLPGAVNIPFGTIGQNLDRLPNNKQIILYCYSGQTSGLAVAATKLLGFNAISYQGGMNFGWKNLELSEDTLETTENPLPEAKDPELTEEDKILWDAVAKFFDEGKNYIEKGEDLHSLIEDNPAAVYVLDIRGSEDFDKGHIEGSENIPFKEVGENLDKLPTNRPVYITCYSGQTAAQILMMLRLNGYNAYSVSRGMAGWDGAELPVVTN